MNLFLRSTFLSRISKLGLGLTVTLLVLASNLKAQSYTKHYIAPAPWNYFTKANELVEQFGTYDPTLDLASYKKPHLDLLENYGSAKISVNAEELEANKTKIVETLNHYNIEIDGPALPILDTGKSLAPCVIFQPCLCNRFDMLRKLKLFTVL